MEQCKTIKSPHLGCLLWSVYQHVKNPANLLTCILTHGNRDLYIHTYTHTNVINKGLGQVYIHAMSVCSVWLPLPFNGSVASVNQRISGSYILEWVAEFSVRFHRKRCAFLSCSMVIGFQQTPGIKEAFDTGWVVMRWSKCFSEEKR